MHIFIDTETTGFSPHKDEIVQLSFICTNDDLSPLVASNYYFSVDFMPEDAYNVHNLSITRLKYLSNGMKIGDSARDFMQYLNTPDAVFCGHNVQFDLNIIMHNLDRCGYQFTWNKTFDTMLSHTEILNLPMTSNSYDNGTTNKYPKLSEVIDYYGLSHESIAQLASQIYKTDIGGNLHDARVDSTACLLIYKKYLDSQQR